MQRDHFSVRTFPSLESVGREAASYPIRVCIVTDEISGPVRNGGIGSTYYHLAKGLAAAGHSVEVLFLKGPVVQDETPEYWQEHFASFGVALHYLDFPQTADAHDVTSWQVRYAAAYRWLRDRPPYQVIHTSEWRGGMLYALMAKRMGLAFQDTLFVVKTSSPHIWNRHYQMQPITGSDLLGASYAEQKCVELADFVVGGSAHLITFMGEIGYKLPPANVFVQPNIIDFSNIRVDDKRPERQPGDKVQSRQLTFFGRLEARKGIELMCNAVDMLVDGGVIPERVNFLGKFGAALANHGGLSVRKYIEDKAENWPCDITIVDDLNQPEALSFLCSRDMFAVMPSLIENSSMAVYEVLEKRIPFIATAVGGTPELVAEIDHPECLVEPTVQALADRMRGALEEGLTIARPAFSNDANLTAWYEWHNYIGRRMSEEGAHATVADLTRAITPAITTVDTVGFGCLVRAADQLETLETALTAARFDAVALAFTDPRLRPALSALAGRLNDAGVATQMLDRVGHTAGEGLTEMAKALGTDAIVLSSDTAVVPAPDFLSAVRTALSHCPTALVTSFFTTDEGTEGRPLGCDVASQFESARAYGPEIVAMRTSRFEELGPFEPYDARHGLIHEYVTRNSESGSDLLVIPEPLLTWHEANEQSEAIADNPLHGYFRAKPLIDKSGINARKVFLASLSPRRAAKKQIQRPLRLTRPDHDEPTWLVPSNWSAVRDQRLGNSRIATALDDQQNRLLLFAFGPGERSLAERDTQLETVRIFETGKGTDSEVTIDMYEFDDAWSVGRSRRFKWRVERPEGEARVRHVTIAKLDNNVFAVNSATPIMTPGGLFSMADLRSLQEDPAAGRAYRQARDHARRSQHLRCDVAEPSDRFHSGLLLKGENTRWRYGEWLRGWVWSVDRPDSYFRVVVTQDGIELANIIANVELPVLLKRNPSLKERYRHGFRFLVGAHLLYRARNGPLQIAINGTDKLIGGGALSLEPDAEGESSLVFVRESEKEVTEPT